MMSHIWMVAGRDFRATVGSKGFIIGFLLTPVLITALVMVGPRIINSRNPQVQGEVAVIDRSGSVLAELRESLTPATIVARRASADTRRVSGPRAPRGVPIPVLRVVERSASAEVQQEKAWLIQEKSDLPRHLAFIVIPSDAIVREAGKREYGTYELYVSRGLD